MFLGESIALIVYFAVKYKDPEGHRQRQEQAVREGKELQFNKLKIAIPALCDCLASCMHLFALNFIAGSIFMMMRGGTIITTLIFSVLLLGLKPKRHQIVGSFLAFIGIGIVGTSALIFSTSKDKDIQSPLVLYVSNLGVADSGVSDADY